MIITRRLILITFYKPKNYIALFHSYSLEKESKNDEKIVYKLYIQIQQLITTSNPFGIDECLHPIQPKVTADMYEHLLQPYSPEEIRQALIQMHLTKTPGPDGFPTLFYQQYWHIVNRAIFFQFWSLVKKGQLYSHRPYSKGEAANQNCGFPSNQFVKCFVQNYL